MGGTLTKLYELQVFDDSLSDGGKNHHDKRDMTEVGDWWRIDIDSEVNVGDLNRALTK